VFYLQAREADTLITLKCEKEQVAALAEYMSGLLARLPDSPAAGDKPDLLQPIEAAWQVGSLGVGLRRRSRPRRGDRQRAGRGGRGRRGGGQARRARAGLRALRHHPGPGRRLRRAGPRAAARRSAHLPDVRRAKDPAGHACPRSNGHVVAKA